MGGEISPVNAPDSASWTFCANTSTREPRALSTIAWSAV